MNREKRVRIGYFNQILGEYWSFPPWLGAIEAAHRYNVDLVSFYGNAILDSDGFNEQGNILYDLAKGGRLDGLITWKGHISANLSDEEFLSFCRQYCIPFVTIEGSFPGHPSVTYGNDSGMRMVVKHLIEKHGYEKIGFVGAYIENEAHSVFRERYRAYCEEMAGHSLGIDPSWVKPWRPWEDLYGRSPSELLDEWLREAVSFGLEAIIGVCDPVALWVMERLEALGFSVPHNMAVAGYDYSALSRIATVPLTTVDPSWTEMGAATIEVLLAILDGRPVPEKTGVKPRLVVARTCGCLEKNVVRAGGRASRRFFYPADKRKITGRMSRFAGKENSTRRGCGELLTSFFIDAQGSGEPLFLNTLEKILKAEVMTGKDVIAWQDVISVLQTLADSMLVKQEQKEKAGLLCQQARVLTANIAGRAQESKWVWMENAVKRERSLGMDLISTFDMDQLMDLLAESLPELGISGFYVALYEEPAPYRYPDPVPECSRLVLAYNEQGRIKVDAGGLRYRSREIVPEAVWPKERAVNFSVHALYFQDNQIGFIVFDAVPRKIDVFDSLRIQLSSALQGVLLVKKTEEQMKDLSEAKERLEKSYSDLKENQQRLIASEKMASLGRLSAGIAHEMNTPLATVRAALREVELLAEEYMHSIGKAEVLAEDHHEIAQEILKNISIARRAAEKSVGFIRGIRAQTRSAIGEHKQVFNATLVARDTFAVLEHQFKKNQCMLKKRLQEDVHLYGNPQAFSQILTNLLVNAVDACKEEGGEISVCLAKEPEDKIILTVTDNGAGISREILTKIFDPFFTTKSFGEGTGLGLSIVYDLVVNEFNGAVEVESVPGNTVFTICFPEKEI